MKILKRKRSLAETHPHLAKQWHPTKNGDLTHYYVTYGSQKKVWWVCDEGHEWKTTVKSRTSQHTGCPGCHDKVRGQVFIEAVLSKTGSLAEKHPEIAKQWHPTKNKSLTPHDLTSGSNRKVWWKCEKGHVWKTTVGNRTRGTNCPKCRKSRILLEIHPDIANQWHPTKNANLTPANVTAGSRKKVWWVCDKKHEWKTTVASRTQGRGCPKCYAEKRKRATG